MAESGPSGRLAERLKAVPQTQQRQRVQLSSTLMKRNSGNAADVPSNRTFSPKILQPASETQHHVIFNDEVQSQLRTAQKRRMRQQALRPYATQYQGNDNSLVSRVGTAFTASTLSGQARTVQTQKLRGDLGSRGVASGDDYGQKSHGKASTTTRSHNITSVSANTGANPKLVRLRQYGNFGHVVAAQRAVPIDQQD